MSSLQNRSLFSERPADHLERVKLGPGHRNVGGMCTGGGGRGGRGELRKRMEKATPFLLPQSNMAALEHEGALSACSQRRS